MKVTDLSNVSIPSSDGHTNNGEGGISILLSCNLRYSILDLEKSFSAVEDFEEALATQTLTELSRHARGITLESWRDKKEIEKLEDEITKDLRKVVTDKWGLKIHQFSITDHPTHQVKRLMHEGIGGIGAAVSEE
jgi:hypothetical protein